MKPAKTADLLKDIGQYIIDGKLRRGASSELAKKYNVSRQYISQRIKELDLAIQHGTAKIDREDEIIAFIKENINLKDFRGAYIIIKNKFGIARKTLLRLLKRNNILVEMMDKKYDKNCYGCGKPYVSRSKESIACSHSCRWSARRNKINEERKS